MKHLLHIFLALFFLFFSPPHAYGETDVTIRVGLASNITQADFRVIEGEFSLIDAATGLPIGIPQQGEKWTVRKEGLNIKVSVEGIDIEVPCFGPLLLIPQDSSSKQQIFRYLNVQYRDSLIFQNETNGLLVVNNVDIEKYLYGVVGKEIGYFAPTEALKAQAIVSRSYALSSKGRNTRYDVGIDTNTQVYGGYDAELLPGAERVKQAVDETKGLVIYYKNQLVKAFFHANAGGYTENSENVWLEELPYLKAIESPYDRYALTYPNQTSSGWPANSYEWDFSYSRQDLANKITEWNNKNSNKIDIGTLTDLKVFKTQSNSNQDTLSSRVTRLDFIGSSGQKSITKDTIRSVLGLKSALFNLNFDSTIYILNEYGESTFITSAGQLNAIGEGSLVSPLNGNEDNYNIVGLGTKENVPKIFQNVKVTGKGHGHGVGMSQWGAQGMAEAGYKYYEILEHYYNQGKNDGLLTIKGYN